MHYRSGLSLAILIAAACSAGVDSPVAVETPNTSPSFAREGVKPPPPLGTQETEIQIFSENSETDDFSTDGVETTGGPSAASAIPTEDFSAQVRGRYFANTQGTNGWIAFVSVDCAIEPGGAIASPGAKLQYNEKTGKTQGHGTLTSCNGVVLDLSKIEITSGGFGGCVLDDDIYKCRTIYFDYDGEDGGFLNLGEEFES